VASESVIGKSVFSIQPESNSHWWHCRSAGSPVLTKYGLSEGGRSAGLRPGANLLRPKRAGSESGAPLSLRHYLTKTILLANLAKRD